MAPIADPRFSPMPAGMFFSASVGNALPLLHQIRHALTALLTGGTETIIDLGAIPFGPGDEAVLEETLGTGEVHAVLTAMGESHVRETAIPGVWRIDHRDMAGALQSRFVEITMMPDILKTQREDAVRGLKVLEDRLAALDGGTPV